jgi:transposase
VLELTARFTGCPALDGLGALGKAGVEITDDAPYRLVGCPWRLVPSDLPPWETIYRWFARLADLPAEWSKQRGMLGLSAL